MQRIPVSRIIGAIFGAATTVTVWRRRPFKIAFLAAAFAPTTPASIKRVALDKVVFHVRGFSFCGELASVYTWGKFCMTN